MQIHSWRVNNKKSLFLENARQAENTAFPQAAYSKRYQEFELTLIQDTALLDFNCIYSLKEGIESGFK